MLRHSFATLLLELGIYLRYIREMLVRSRTKTTEIYIHVCSKQLTKTQNPLNNLNPNEPNSVYLPKLYSINPTKWV